MTAFFFNFLVKISSLLIFCLSSSFAEISVNKNDDNKIELEYALNYQMNEEFEEIIDKGISINLIEEIKIVKERHGLLLDADAFPIDDGKTFELFQRGETVGIF